MSGAVSPVTDRRYGLAAVCRAWQVPRATVYRHQAPPREEPRRRPGPVGPMPDAALLGAIRAVLADNCRGAAPPSSPTDWPKPRMPPRHRPLVPESAAPAGGRGNSPDRNPAGEFAPPCCDVRPWPDRQYARLGSGSSGSADAVVGSACPGEPTGLPGNTVRVTDSEVGIR
jgi:hypothetical protein